MKREEVAIMQRIDAIVWKELVSVLEAHPEESLHAPTSPKWTSKDVFAHMARWLKYSNDNIETYCSGKPLPESKETPEEKNTRWQNEDRDKTLSVVKKAAQQEFARRQQLVDAIPLEKWDKELLRIASYDGANHFAAHLNYMVIPI